MQKKVTIYTTSTCHYCVMAKDFFKKHGIEYTAHDVGDDVGRREEMEDRSGQKGVPVIIIGDNVVTGFNKDKVSQLLGIKE